MGKRLPGSQESLLRFYDRIAASYDLITAMEAVVQRRAARMLDPAPGNLILDVGCGTGALHRFLPRLTDANGLLVGLDLSMPMLRRCTEKRVAAACQANAGQLPFASETFDSLISTFFFDLAPESDVDPLLDSMWGVVKPGGTLVIVTMARGESVGARVFNAIWKRLHSIAPTLTGGCQPVELAPAVRRIGGVNMVIEYLETMMVPSKIIRFSKPSHR